MKIFYTIVISLSLFFTFYLFQKKINYKKFFIFFLFITFPLISFYQYSGNNQAFGYNDSLRTELLNSKDIEPRKIIIFLENQLKENPNDYEGWRILARTCLMTGYIQKANLYYSRGLKYFPENIELLTEYALFKKGNNEYKESIKLLKKIANIFPKDNDNLILLTELYIEDKNKVEAKRMIKVLALNKINEKLIKDLKKKINKF